MNQKHSRDEHRGSHPDRLSANGMGDIGIRPEKERHVGDLTQRLKVFFWFLPFWMILFSFMFGLVKGMLIALILSAVLTVVVLLVADRIGSLAKLIYGGGPAHITIREQMEGRLKAARVAKMNQEFKTALKIVNEILEKDPRFSEALFVKAQILAQGFSQPRAAAKYARQVKEQTPEGETLHVWADSLLKDVSGRRPADPLKKDR